MLFINSTYLQHTTHVVFLLNLKIIFGFIQDQQIEDNSHENLFFYWYKGDQIIMTATTHSKECPSVQAKAILANCRRGYNACIWHCARVARMGRNHFRNMGIMIKFNVFVEKRRTKSNVATRAS